MREQQRAAAGGHDQHLGAHAHLPGHGRENARGHGHGDGGRAHGDAHHGGQHPGQHQRRHVRSHGQAHGGLRGARVAQNAAQPARGRQNDQHAGDGGEGLRRKPAQAAARAVRFILNPAAEQDEGHQNRDEHGDVRVAGQAQDLVGRAARH